MALPEDFSKIYGSTATGGLTPISDVDYAKGWEFVGSNPPTKNDFSYLQNLSDLKSQWLYSNKLQRTDPFGDIKSDGTVNTALENLGLETIVSDLAETNARIGYALLSPATQISIGQRIVLANPFGNNTPVIVKAELLFSGTWFNTGWLYNASTNNSYGTSASYSQGEGISVQAGSFRLNTNGPNAGGGFTPTTELTTGTYRVHVWKVTA